MSCQLGFRPLTRLFSCRPAYQLFGQSDLVCPNLKETDRDDWERLDLIRNEVSKSQVGELVKTPGSFLILEQEMVEFAKIQDPRSILSLGECLVIGVKQPEEVEAALFFFHCQYTATLLPPHPPQPCFHQAPNTPRLHQCCGEIQLQGRVWGSKGCIRRLWCHLLKIALSQRKYSTTRSSHSALFLTSMGHSIPPSFSPIH